MPLSTEELARLYAVPPAEFVRAREAVAKRLRAAGDAEAAAAVKSLKRLPATMWAINRLAHEQPAEIQALLAAGAALEQAQAMALAGQPGVALREATRRERECLARLVEAAHARLEAAGHASGPAARREIQQTLHAAAIGTEAVRTQLRTGTLPNLLEPPTFFGEPAGLPALEPSPAPSEHDAAAERARLGEATETAARLAHEAERAAKEAERVQARLEAAQTEVARLREDARQADEDARAARARADEAQGKLLELSRSARPPRG